MGCKFFKKMLEALAAKGWFLTEEGFDSIRENLEKENPTLEDYIVECLNTDLRHITKAHLPRDLTQITYIQPPLVLQLHSTLNLATPAQRQTSNPRLLQFIFTDGDRKIRAVEILGSIDELSLSTAPGTKVLIEKPVEFREGILLIGGKEGHLNVLGGTVEEMIREWKAGKQFIQRSRAKERKNGEKREEEGPPMFIPFKTKNKQSHSPIGSQQTQLQQKSSPVEGDEKKKPSIKQQHGDTKKDNYEKRKGKSGSNNQSKRQEKNVQEKSVSEGKERERTQNKKNQSQQETDTPFPVPQPLKASFQEQRLPQQSQNSQCSGSSQTTNPFPKAPEQSQIQPHHSQTLVDKSFHPANLHHQQQRGMNQQSKKPDREIYVAGRGRGIWRSEGHN